MNPVLTVERAEDVAARALAAIPEWIGGPDYLFRYQQDHRERITSDLAGLREHVTRHCWDDQPCADGSRYSDGLLRTASLYDVTP